MNLTGRPTIRESDDVRTIILCRKSFEPKLPPAITGTILRCVAGIPSDAAHSQPYVAYSSARPDRGERGERYDNGRGNGRYNGNRADEDDVAEPATIDVNVLPPSFGSDGMVPPIPDFQVEAEEATPAPRRRGRPRRAAPEDEVPAEG